MSKPLHIEGEHLFETFCYCEITWFLFSTIICGIESGEYVTAGIGARRKLDERGKQVV